MLVLAREPPTNLNKIKKIKIKKQLYLCANTHAREGGRGAGERALHIHLRLVHLKQAALRQLQQQDSAYI